MSFFESINRLYNDNEFDFLDVLNESIHVSDLVLNWPEPNSSVLYGIHTGACFYNHKNRMFEIIYDLSNDRCVFQAKREKVKYPIEDCRIDKVEDGWYWVSFLEPNCTIRSYMITKQ